MSQLWALLKRDLRLAVREGGALGTALGFYLVVVAMLPFGMGPDLNLLARVASGVLWVGLLLAALLSLPRIFDADLEDGSLEVLATGAVPLEGVVAAKAFAHWLTTAIPLALMAPVLGLLLNLDIAVQPVLLASMLGGSPAVSFLGAIGAALTLRGRRGGLLIALLVLPLCVPTLIFGVSVVSAVVLGTGGAQASFLILLAISIASLAIGPVAAAAALRIQLG
ncbi:MAG: heme exporter protein CcmB [Hyphomicrobiaceae bacterium]